MDGWERRELNSPNHSFSSSCLLRLLLLLVAVPHKASPSVHEPVIHSQEVGGWVGGWVERGPTVLPPFLLLLLLFVAGICVE